MSIDQDDTEARRKPTVVVGTIGHVDHGKTALAAALMRIADLQAQRGNELHEVVFLDESAYAEPLAVMIRSRPKDISPRIDTTHDMRRGKGDRKRDPKWGRKR